MADKFNTIDDFDVENKTVLVRIDINSPVDPSSGIILDDTRLKLHAKTIKELSNKGAKVVLLAHQSRPGKKDFTDLSQHANALSDLLNLRVKYIDSIFSKAAKEAIKQLKPHEILLLENVRFFSEESLSRPAEAQAETLLVRQLSPVIDYFVNDAFAAAHRSQASLVGFTLNTPSAAGRVMEKELTVIQNALDNVEHPCVFLLGGMKPDDSIDVMENVLSNGTADSILTTGIVGNIVLWAAGVDLGDHHNYIRKYQPVDGLMTGILKGLQEEKFPGSCADNGNGRILGVYSPVHRIGKTTFSLKLGKALAQSEDVLYLNLETYAGMGGYFRDQDAPDLANVLYYAKQERDDIGIRIASMVKRMGDLDYIPPMKVWTDLRAVHTEEWKTLFERLISQSVYSVIILDIGNGMEDVFQLLRLCDQILMPCAEDVYAMAKIAQYQHMLKVLRYQELESRTMYINMGKNMRQTVKETVELLKESTEKRFFYAEGRTTS